jgi:hypothetical protein
MVRKTCKKCGEVKPLEAYYEHPRTRDGRKGSCKACDAVKTNAWRRDNPERTKAINRRVKLKKNFGITPEQYDEMLAAQGGVCASCSTDKPGGPYGIFAVDHDHSTGKVRGLLCKNCNLAIGMLGDSAEGVRKALAYLTREE